MSEEKRYDEIQGAILHVYDGIEEADNQLPMWWVATFVGAILFAAGYWIVYESLEAAKNPLAAYTDARLEAANRGGPVTDEELEALASDKLTLSAAQKNYDRNCVKCHGAKLEGKVGPNLTDANWLYGGAPSDIYESILSGRPRGMPAWGTSQGPGAVKQLTALVLSKRNTNVPGKEPQGEVWTPSAKPPAEGAPAEGAPAEEAPAEQTDPSKGDAPAEAAPAPTGDTAPAKPAPATDQAPPAEAASPG